MRNLFLFAIVLCIGCSKPTSYPPVGGVLSSKDLETSKNRAKHLNEMERSQIQEWMKGRTENYYPMALNYWIDTENLLQRNKRNDGEILSYQYEIYDFDEVKVYEKPIFRRAVVLGKIEEIKAIDDAVRYLDEGEDTTLLVPSVLAFGTYGDGDKIPNDTPLIIKLKVLN